MIGWLDYDYVIASAPNQDEFPFLCRELACRIAMEPRRTLLRISRADACLIVLNGAQGLKRTGANDLYDFGGNRSGFGIWMAESHPNIAYSWLDQWLVAFADRAAQLSFDDDFCGRVIRCVHIPRAA